MEEVQSRAARLDEQVVVGRALPMVEQMIANRALRMRPPGSKHCLGVRFVCIDLGVGCTPHTVLTSSAFALMKPRCWAMRA